MVNGQEQGFTLAHRLREGGREMLLFVHGLGCSKEAFDLAWGQESLRPFSLLSVDLLGFGASPKPPDFPYTMEAHGTLLAQVIAQFPENRVHFVGSSMGPLIGLAMPEATLASLGSFTNMEARLLAADCGNSGKAAALTFAQFTREFWPALKAETRHAKPTAYDLEHALPEAFYRGAKSVVELAESGWSYDKFLSLAVPKIYFYGDEAKSTRMQVLPKLHGKVPMRQIPASGHFMMLDNPDAFYAALWEFIGQSISK